MPKTSNEAWRVYFSAWGASMDRVKLPAYAVQAEGEDAIAAVCRAIQRASRMDRGSARLDSWNSTSMVYQATFGRSCRRKRGQCDQGWTPLAEVWISIPRDVAKRGERW